MQIDLKLSCAKWRMLCVYAIENAMNHLISAPKAYVKLKKSKILSLDLVWCFVVVADAAVASCCSRLLQY